MPALYNANKARAKDRVRAMIGDRAAPWRFPDDEEVVSELRLKGFVGDPTQPSDPQDLPELDAAISLMESEADDGGAIKTVKQGSVQRIDQSGKNGRASILTNLRARRLTFVSGTSDGYGGPVVADGFANEGRGQCPGFGFLIR